MLLGPKKKKLEPLTDNDIMLAILRNEKSVDLTEEYRLWLVTLKSNNIDIQIWWVLPDYP